MLLPGKKIQLFLLLILNLKSKLPLRPRFTKSHYQEKITHHGQHRMELKFTSNSLQRHDRKCKKQEKRDFKKEEVMRLLRPRLRSSLVSFEVCEHNHGEILYG